MSAEEAVNRLMEIHPKGFDLSLDRVTKLLEKLGSPHLSIPPAFHIAGTNGKGSTSAYLRAILEAAGQTTHVHTSPHLVHWNERYRIGKTGGGEYISDADLETVINHVADANGGKHITVFEVMSAVGFELFANHPADFSIMEVGLGGRFDATNVLQNPAACLITPVGLDHQAYLGDTIEKIAFEKAGIIKEGAPVFIGEQEDAARQVIEARAHQLGCAVQVARQDFDYYEQHGRFVFQDENGLLDLPLPVLFGEHQLANAALAISACRFVLPDLASHVYEEAMTRVVWPGRFERLKEGNLEKLFFKNETRKPDSKPEIWIDGGHNPQAGQAIAKALHRLNDHNPMPLIMIVGMLTTKEPDGFFEAFEGLVDEVWTVPVSQSDAGFDPQELAEVAKKSQLSANASSDFLGALNAINSKYPNEKIRILICGSLYLVGDVLDKNGTPPQ